MNLSKKRMGMLCGLIAILFLSISCAFVFHHDVKSIKAADTSIFTFTRTNDTECSVRLKDKTATIAMVPEKVVIEDAEYTVTAVAASGFASASNLTKVRLPLTVKEIGSAAFTNCKNLESITIPAVETIGANAFAMCSSLNYLLIPDTVVSVAGTILRNASTQVYVRASEAETQEMWASNWNANNINQTVEYESDFMPEVEYKKVSNTYAGGISSTSAPTDGYVVDVGQPFSEGHREGLTHNTSINEVHVYIGDTYTDPDTGEELDVLGIEPYAFFYNQVTTLTIGYANSPLHIGDSAFEGLEGVNAEDRPSVVINRKVTLIKDNAISNNVFNDSKIYTLVLSDSVTELGSSMFNACINLQDICFKAPESNLTQAEEQAIVNGLNLQRIVNLPTTLTTIGAEAFSGVTQVQELYVPDSVINVGYNAFVDWGSGQLIAIDYEKNTDLPAWNDATETGWHSKWAEGCACTIQFNGAYEIKYELNGGTHNGNPTNYTPKDTVSLNDAVREGYTFGGWYEQEDFSGSRVYGIDKGSSGDKKYFAKWTAIEYDIKYYSNQPKSSHTVEGTMANSHHIYDNPQKLSLNQFSLVGWTFSGWNTESGGSGEAYTDGATVPDLTTENNDTVHLYAQWQAITYYVSYYRNKPSTASGLLSGNMDEPSKHVFDTASPLTDNAFSLVGWKFNGWNTKEDGSGINYANKEEILTIGSVNESNNPLFAQWTPNNYQVQYNISKPGNATGAISGTMSVSNFLYDDISANLSANAFKIVGWTFTGWKALINGERLSFTDEAHAYNLTANDKEVLVFEAQWAANVYTVYYDANGPLEASGSMQGNTTNSMYTYDVSKNLTANGYTLIGWKFLGWNTKRDGTGKLYEDGENVKNITEDLSIVLYAQWESRSYNVVYDSNYPPNGYGSIIGTMHISNHTYDRPSTLRENAFIFNGYKFLGWSKTKNGSVNLLNGASISTLNQGIYDTVSIYAVWEAIQYDIYRLNLDNGNKKLHGQYTIEQDVRFNDYTAEGYTWTFREHLIPRGTTGEQIIHYTFRGILYYVTVEAYGPGGVNLNYNEIYQLQYGTKFSIIAPDFDGYRFQWFIHDDGWDPITMEPKFTKYLDQATTFLNLCKKPGDTYAMRIIYAVQQTIEPAPCVAPGTMITLADGTQKAVETLTGDELLLVWDLRTGTFGTAPILFIDHDDAKNFQVINLYFSDGTSVKVIYEHAFWDFNLNKYVFLRADAAQYIGHWFNKQGSVHGEMYWTKVQLVDVVVQTEYTSTWSPVTYRYMCYYVNGLLSMPGATEGLINIFEVNGETMQYDQAALETDIEKFGLFTYEEFNELIPISEEMFISFNGAYLKVSMGKGLIDVDTLKALIQRYSEHFEQTQ